MSVPEQERPLGQERIVVVEGGLRASRSTEILLAALLAAILAAVIAFGAHLSNKMDRLGERVSDNGERIARTEERISHNGENIARNGESIARIEALLLKPRADATPPAQQKSAQRR